MASLLQIKSIKQKILNKPETLLISLLLLPLTIALFLIMYFSLQWRMVHDTPLLHYVALLLDKYNFVIYRDVFETSMPGSILFHLALVKIVGYSDLSFHMVDILWLCLLLIVTFRFMRVFGQQVAWAGTILFALAYYQLGHNTILQRDYLGILPLAVAIWIALIPDRLKSGLKAFFIGILFGITATIKPQFALGIVLLAFIHEKKQFESKKSRFKSLVSLILPAGAGVLLPLLLCLGWLWRKGALPYFWEMLTSYLPLHVQLSGNHRLLFGWEKAKYLLSGFLNFGGHAVWLIPALAGALIALRFSGLTNKQKKTAWLLIALTLIYSIYPVLAGQFWDYHWIPFLYCVMLLSSLTLVHFPETRSPKWPRSIGPVILTAIIVLALRPPKDFVLQIRGRPLPPPKQGVVDALARFLKTNVGPGDTVQPLDWVGGSIHAMLLTRVRIATPFLYDYHFYHHIANPFIMQLRKRFIQGLEQSKPKFIIEVTRKGKVSGKNTTKNFDELRRLLSISYCIQDKTKNYIIYRRKL